MFSREELEFIRDLCVRWNAFAITDEIYEHILYDGTKHISMASLDGMRDRTITINGMSKTYSVTGWRVGWAIAPPEASTPIRKVHDFLTVGAAAPLQQAGAVALELPASYYQKLAERYRVKRDRMLGILDRGRFPLLQARRRVLHHDRHFALRFSGRSVLRAISGGENRHRRRARLELLQRSGDGRAPGALHVLQERIDAGRLRGEAVEASRLIAREACGFSCSMKSDKRAPESSTKCALNTSRSSRVRPDSRIIGNPEAAFRQMASHVNFRAAPGPIRFLNN